MIFKHLILHLKYIPKFDPYFFELSRAETQYLRGAVLYSQPRRYTVFIYIYFPYLFVRNAFLQEVMSITLCYA